MAPQPLGHRSRGSASGLGWLQAPSPVSLGALYTPVRRVPNVTAGPHPWDLPGRPAETAENRQGPRPHAAPAAPTRAGLETLKGRAAPRRPSGHSRGGVAGGRLPSSRQPHPLHAPPPPTHSSSLLWPPALGAASDSPPGLPWETAFSQGHCPKLSPGAPVPCAAPPQPPTQTPCLQIPSTHVTVGHSFFVNYLLKAH